MEVTFTDFSSVFSVWRQYLWPKRLEPIASRSSLLFKKGHDLNYLSAEVFFVKLEREGKIIGVCSGQKTQELEFRSRGLWVAKEFRRQGLASRLFLFVEEEAKKRGAKHLWTLARHSAKEFYQAMQMKDCGKTQQFEYGPHFWMSKKL